MDKQQIFEAVTRERDYQDAKWGVIGEHPHSVGEWLLVVESELHEAKSEWCRGDGDYGALLELLQVVAVGVAALEQHGVIERSSIGMLTAMYRDSAGRDAVGRAAGGDE